MPIDYFNNSSRPAWSNKRVGSKQITHSGVVRMRKIQKAAKNRAKLDINRRADVQFGNQNTSKRPKKSSRFKFKNLIPNILLLVVLGFIFVTAVFAWYSKDLPDPNKIIDRSVIQSTKIYDREGKNLLYDIHGAQQRTLIELKDLPPHVTQATIAIEDKDFYKHSGFSILAMIRTTITNVLQGKMAGGSTITQQFVKNAILTNEKKISRKIKELILAYRIEKKYSKEEILKMYFNEIPYGSVAYGIESASNIYFDKHAKDLTIAESATLAAMTQAPSYYSPYGKHRDILLERQQYVLTLMQKQGYITQDQYNIAKDEKINFKPPKESLTAPHFVFYVKTELEEMLGVDTVEKGGLKVITTLDLEKQKKAEDIIKEKTVDYEKTYSASNAALLAIDNSNGDIVSMVGSRDFFSEDIDGQVNVTLASRQPGSSIKPFVYELAFEKGYQPETVVFDLPTIFKTDSSDYEPQNYNLKTNGPVTLRKSLAGSLNIPAVKVLYLVGIQSTLDHLKNLGYSTIRDASKYGLSLVLGGLEVKMIEHVNSFATLARGGVYKPTRSILRVEDSRGNILYEAKEIKEKTVLDGESVRKISSVLSDNSARAFVFGEKNYLTLGNTQVAVKTGTTNDFNDAWTVGYTQGITTGVWIGNNDNRKMKNSADGSKIAAPIWQAYMQNVVASYPSSGFSGYEPKQIDKPMLNGNYIQTISIKIDNRTGELANPDTPIEFITQKIISKVHDILHYVNKEDPLGPIPDNPDLDPNYTAWEEPIAKWAGDNGFLIDNSFEINNNIEENKPDLKIITPANNEIIKSQDINIQIEAIAKSGKISRAVFKLDGTQIGYLTNEPYLYNYKLADDITNGEHKLSVTIFDEFQNFQEESISIIIDK